MRSEVIEPLLGATGTLVAEHLQLNGVEAEDHLVLAGITDDGQALTTDQARRLLDISATARPADPSALSPAVAGLAEQRVAALRSDISARQGAWFDDEMDKLDRWAEDKRTGLKAVLREHDDALKALKREARQAASLPEKLAIQKQIKQIETAREQHLELPVEEFLSRARPLPPHDEMVIEDLGAEEGEAFVLAVGS